MRSAAGAGRFAIAAAVLLFLPIGIAIGAWLAAPRAAADVPPTALVVRVNVVDYDDRRGVEVTPTWAEGPSLYAPDWAGTVGRVTDATALAAGDFVASIDGVDRMAVATPEPFYRVLRLGDQGADVGWLHSLLAQLGHLADEAESEAFTAQSLEAVVALAETLGYDDDVSAFDPTWTVWLPSEPFPIATLNLEPGQPAPPAGAVVATQPQQLASVAIRPVSGGDLDLDRGAYALTVRGLTVSLSADATIGPPDLEALSAELSPTEEVIQGTVHRSAPMRVWSVPTSGLTASEAGRVCMWVVDDGEYAAVLVDVVGSQAGFTYVEPRGDAPDVLANPAQVLETAECPSS